MICDLAGREGMAGIMQAVNIIATLEALDGCEDDLDKVLAVEAIAKKNLKTAEGKEEE
ncbi:MAG: hypothetical protein WCZ86_05850 [Desulfurivibrionaceae bacterium]|jgi:hypothetical protein